MVVAGEEEGVVGEVALRGVGVDRVRGRKASKGNIEYRLGARENDEMKNSAPGIWSCVLRALMVVVRIQDIMCQIPSPLARFPSYSSSSCCRRSHWRHPHRTVEQHHRNELLSHHLLPNLLQISMHRLGTRQHGIKARKEGETNKIDSTKVYIIHVAGGEPLLDRCLPTKDRRYVEASELHSLSCVLAGSGGATRNNIVSMMQRQPW